MRAFLAVADTGSLSGAARRTGVSQPTLGRQVRQLEAALGQRLFDRQPRGLAPTDTARALIEPARRMQAAMSEIELTAAGRQTELSGPVRITASDMVALHVLPPILAELHTAEPGITVDLVASNASENLLFRESDIAVRMYRPRQLDLVARHLGDAELGMFAARRYLDRAGRPRSVADLGQHSMIGYDRSEEIIRGMQARGLAATHDWFALRCDSHPVYWALVRAGCGIGFGQATLGRADPAIEEIDLGLDLPVLPVWLATHRSLRQTPRIARVWDALAAGLAPWLS
ncbi:LysR family transcriptional regulator [Roseovarius salinarum]|uniref:LysR family transcriptional regulator n=1 Tax=Roseovarius salinarum TaxID=1981892 RepID=UPI002FCDC333